MLISNISNLKHLCLSAGQETSHWEYFLTQRSQRIDKVVVETNKILLRLDKLVNKGPPWSDQNKRKGNNLISVFKEFLFILYRFCGVIAHIQKPNADR